MNFVLFLGVPASLSKSLGNATNIHVVQFPMMAKVEVNGSAADPFYKFLKAKQGGLLVPDIKWCVQSSLTPTAGRMA